jgi:hypothetical protein
MIYPDSLFLDIYQLLVNFINTSKVNLAKKSLTVTNSYNYFRTDTLQINSFLAGSFYNICIK